MSAYVYLIKNKINNKCYVGKTKMEPPIERYKLHLRVSKNIPLYLKRKKVQAIHYAIAKYGSDNFEFKILHSVNTEKEAYNLEIQEIKRRKTLTSQGHGYNITKGGDGAKLTPESLAKLRASLLLAQTPELRKIKQISAWRARDNGAWGVKLNKEQVLEIKKLIMSGAMTNRELATKFGVRPQTIGRIQKNQIFKDVLAHTPVLEHGKDGFYQPGYSARKGGDNHASKLSLDDAINMIRLYRGGNRMKDIADQFKCSRQLVFRVVNYKHYLTYDLCIQGIAKGKSHDQEDFR